MPTVFTRIINGEIPGRFLWSDTTCVAFLTAAPMTPGHTLVVPREPIDQWVDVPQPLRAQLLDVAAAIGQAQRVAFAPERIGLLAQGFEVPHTHLHVWPTNSVADFDFTRVNQNPDPAELDWAGHALRDALLAGEHASHVPADISSP